MLLRSAIPEVRGTADYKVEPVDRSSQRPRIPLTFIIIPRCGRTGMNDECGRVLLPCFIAGVLIRHGC